MEYARWILLVLSFSHELYSTLGSFVMESVLSTNARLAIKNARHIVVKVMQRGADVRILLIATLTFSAIHFLNSVNPFSTSETHAGQVINAQRMLSVCLPKWLIVKENATNCSLYKKDNVSFLNSLLYKYSFLCLGWGRSFPLQRWLWDACWLISLLESRGNRPIQFFIRLIHMWI
jgi:hypothetical protein